MSKLHKIINVIIQIYIKISALSRIYLYILFSQMFGQTDGIAADPALGLGRFERLQVDTDVQDADLEGAGNHA